MRKHVGHRRGGRRLPREREREGEKKDVKVHEGSERDKEEEDQGGGGRGGLWTGGTEVRSVDEREASCIRWFLSFNVLLAARANSKHWFTTSFLQPLPYLVTP